jgi:O-6-methylguanine DNA methyltransferase
MFDADYAPLAEGRQFVHACRQLDIEPAPPSLKPSVMDRLGDRYAPIAWQHGSLFVAYNNVGIAAIMRAANEAEFEQAFRARFGREAQRVRSLPQRLSDALQRRLAGAPNGDVPVDLRGLTPFEQAVLLKAREIPRGEVRPYAWIAREIGHPRAVRAVGTALGHNPVPLLIPCHRVVRADGQIGNYLLGSDTKRAVLAEEGAAPDVLEQLARIGVRFLGDPGDGTFCLPTCGGMHLRKEQQFLKLHSEREAAAAGLRPCGSCRPVVRV